MVTNASDFIQVGMHLEEGTGNRYIGWTDSEEHNLVPQVLEDVPYYPQNTYWFTVTYTASVWQACAEETTWSDHECGISDESDGTHLKEDVNTSVFFENTNTNANWYSGFPSTISVWGAELYRSGSPQDWGDENRITAHECGGSYSVSNAMGSSLSSGGSATWKMSGIPIYCP